MEHQSTTQSETSSHPVDNQAARLAEKIRVQAKAVKAQLDASQARAKERLGHVQGAVREAVQQAFERVRGGLDLPSRREVSTLAQRLEELDRKIDQAETREPSAKKRKARADGE